MEIKMYGINSQKGYEKSLASQISINPKLFHSYLKYRKVGRPNIDPLRLPSDELTDDPYFMGEHFVNSFSSVFVSNVPLFFK